MRVPLDESHVGDGVGGVLEAAALEDAGEAVAEVEVGGRDGAAEGELEEGVVVLPLLLVAAEGAADPEGAAPAVVDEVALPVSPASWSCFCSSHLNENPLHFSNFHGKSICFKIKHIHENVYCAGHIWEKVVKRRQCDRYHGFMVERLMISREL